MEEAHYELSQVYRHSSIPSAQFSPGTTFFAVAVNDHIIVRITATMQLVRTWQCKPPKESTSPPSALHKETLASAVEPDIKHLAWSPNSESLMAFSPRSAMIWVFDLGDPTEQPRAIVTGGIEGLVKCEWSGNSTELLCFSEHRVSKH